MMDEQHTIDPGEVRLQRNQSVRDTLIEDLTADGGLPSTEEGRNLLLKVLSDSDKSEYTRRKQRIETERNKSEDEARRMIALFLTSGEFSENRSVRDVTPPVKPVFPPIETVAGETDIGRHELTLIEIMGDEYCKVIPR